MSGSHAHPTADELEDYARYGPGRVPERFAGLEEHLLVCEWCRERVEWVDEFIAEVRERLGEQ